MPSKDKWRIGSNSSALVTIDLQCCRLDPGSPRERPLAREFVPRVNQIAAVCRGLGIPVVHVRTAMRPDLSDAGLAKEVRPRVDSEWEFIEGKRGAEFYKDLDVKDSDYVVTKIRYSAFIAGSSSLEPLLRGLGRDTLIVCGIATDVCVGTTTSDGMMLGFRVFLVSDLTTTLTSRRQEMALEVLDSHFAKVVTSEWVLKELSGLA